MALKKITRYKINQGGKRIDRLLLKEIKEDTN